MTTKTAIQAGTIWAEMQAYGEAAAQMTVPTPMIVGEATSIFGKEIDYSKPTYYIPSGVCGFAGVVIKPARGPVVTFLKKLGIGYKHYYGGWYIASWYIAPSTRSSQSYEIACAVAKAAVAVLREYGITAYVESRMD
jgi:hypothetical protein